MLATKCVAVIFDLEYTAWDGSLARGWSGENEDPEIIQIGAIKLCIRGRDLVPEQEFSVLVKPTIRPQLSDYIKELTGIDQENLNQNGITFSEALGNFFDFVPGTAPICANGDDWSFLDWNCKVNQIENPFSQLRFFNLRPILANHLKLSEDSPRLHSYRLASRSQVNGYDGLEPHVAHNALNDARAVAKEVSKIDRTKLPLIQGGNN